MYESHFGFSGPPFQLIPDPSFYFGSRGHSNALAFLKFGAHQGEGFIVVTGEIGAGKTTLVRTLLEGLDPEKVVAAPVVSTQLEPGDLPLAILMAFGVQVAIQNSAQLIADLAAFLTDLSAKGRRALLIIDEAQNLAPEVIEELRVLTNFQLGKQAMLQVFLVGQPELRTMLQSKSMDQLRQRVTASCHLGPLDPAETRAYIQHRLQLVGWNDRPHFDLDALQQLHRWTGGIPRRINRLCNRLLLAAFLEGRDTITADNVEQIAQDLRAEIGEADDIPPQVETGTIPAFQTSTIQPDAGDSGHVQEDVLSQLEAAPIELDLHVPETARLDAMQAGPLDGAPTLAVPGVVAAHEMSAETAEPAPEDPIRKEVHDDIGGARRGRREPVFDAPVQAVAPPPVIDLMPAEPTPVVGEASTLPSVATSAAAVDPSRTQLRAGHGISMAKPSVHSPVAVPQPVSRGIGPLLCLVDSAADYVKARALARVFSDNPKLPAVLTVHTGRAGSVDVGDGLEGVMPGSALDVHLDIDEHGGATGAASALLRFDAVIKEHAPAAVLVMGASDTVLTCSLLAHKSQIPVLRNDAGRRKPWVTAGEDMNAVLMERFADISYITDLATYYTLYRVGIATDRVLCVGDLSDNVMKFAADHTVQPAEVLRRANIPISVLKHPRGYAVATAQLQPHDQPNQDAQALVSRLGLVGEHLPVLWAANEFTIQELRESGQAARLEVERIVLVPSLGYLDCIDLIRRARCLIAGTTGEFVDEAASLSVQTLVLGDGVVIPMKVNEPMQSVVAQGADKLKSLMGDLLAQEPARRPVSDFWDGGPAAKIAAHLEGWLPKRIRGSRADKASRPIKATNAIV